ncbi:microfibril-associated glycoprotein 4-like [Zophobas morio]|uniref:microfibril-associated glycoprotein 4-like n=1 Tax=Zophobas morio TaxID=2755281 RepID=UPI003083E8A6
MSSNTLIPLLTLLISVAMAQNSDFWVVSTTQRPPTQQNSNNVCVSGLKEKLKFYDAQISELKNQLHATRKELLSLVEKEVEHSILTPEDCKDVLGRGYKTSGMYKIKPMYSPKEFWVWCDLTTKGGGWTYIFNRFDGSESFYRNWTDYRDGFGYLSTEFWVGLEHLHHLTNSRNCEVLFELVDWDMKKVYAKYNNFVIGSEEEGYALKSLGTFEGTAGDSLTGHLKMKFTTADRDQDIRKEYNCAVFNKGAWWYNSCYYSHLTGEYVHVKPSTGKNVNKITWNTFHGYDYSLKQVRMMVRPKD